MLGAFVSELRRGRALGVYILLRLSLPFIYDTLHEHVARGSYVSVS